jgi:hypothetical protein
MSNATIPDDDLTVPEAGQYAESVRVETTTVGDGLIGRLARRQQVDTKFGSKTVLTFDQVTVAVSDGETLTIEPDHEYTVWPTPGLLTAIDAVTWSIGDTGRLKLTELVDTGKGNPFKKFGAAVDKRGGANAPF